MSHGVICNVTVRVGRNQNNIQERKKGYRKANSCWKVKIPEPLDATSDSISLLCLPHKDVKR